MCSVCPGLVGLQVASHCSLEHGVGLRVLEFLEFADRPGMEREQKSDLKVELD